jgi:translocator protein
MISLSLLNYLNVIAYVANVLVTYGIGAIGFGGFSTNAALSEKYQTLVTPAGFTFAIWAVIFISQFIFVVVQLLPAFRATPMVAKAIGYDYVGVCFSQIAWTLAFTFEIIWLSLVFMISILYFLLSTVNDQYKLSSIEKTSIRDYFLLKFPFAIHCGWILAATMVNISAVLVAQNVGATIQYYVALGTFLFLLLAAIFCLSFPTRPEFVIPAVLAWASVSLYYIPIVISDTNGFRASSLCNSLHICETNVRRLVQFGIFVELGNPKDLIISTFSESRINLAKTGALVVFCLISVATVIKSILNLIKLRKGAGENASGYHRYEEGQSRSSGSASRLSSKMSLTKISRGSKASEPKSTSPSSKSSGIAEC